MTNVFYVSQYQALSSAGAPLSGAKLYFYRTGSTTAAPVYTSAARTTALANPVVADSQGRFAQVFPDPAIVYRVRLSSSADVQQWQEEGISLSSFMATPAEIQAGVTPVNYAYPAGDLRRYGAVGDGMADDLGAFQSAVKTGSVFIPAGSFKVDGVTSRVGALIMRGEGRSSKLLSDNHDFLTLTQADGSVLENFRVENITPPLTILRRVEVRLARTANLTSGSITMTVADTSGLSGGEQVTGYGIPSGCVVGAVSGTTVTLSKPALLSASNTPVEFFVIRFNTDAAVIATLAASNEAGRYPPNDNDVDVPLSAEQITQAQIGPRLNLSGNRILVNGISGRHLSILFNACSNSEARNCDLQGGWNWAGIAFLNFTSAQTQNNKAINNVIQDHAYSGVLFMGCDGCTLSGNISYGCGEAGFKLFSPSAANGRTCSRIHSTNNRAVACYQGGFDFQSIFPTVITPSVTNSFSLGDYAAWGPKGGFGFQGSGWTINISAELNAGPPLLAYVSDSTISGVFRENGYANLNPTVPNTCAIVGSNNIAQSIRILNETNRPRLGYQMAFYGGSTAATSSMMVNCDFRDTVGTAPGLAYQLSGQTSLFNVRTNGSPTDKPPPA